MIDIKGIDKAELLAALVNGARPDTAIEVRPSEELGFGRLQDDGKGMSTEEAQTWIDEVRSHDTVTFANKRLSFDYVKGRPINSNIAGDEFDERLYDRDQGQGAAAAVVARLRGGP